MDFNDWAARLLSEKNEFHIVIPGTAPYEANNWFLLLPLSLDYVSSVLAQLIGTGDLLSE